MQIQRRERIDPQQFVGVYQAALRLVAQFPMSPSDPLEQNARIAEDRGSSALSSASRAPLRSPFVLRSVGQVDPRFRQPIVERKCLLYQWQHPRRHLGARNHAPDTHDVVSTGQHGVGGCVLGVSLDDTLEETLSGKSEFRNWGSPASAGPGGSRCRRRSTFRCLCGSAWSRLPTGRLFSASPTFAAISSCTAKMSAELAVIGFGP